MERIYTDLIQKKSNLAASNNPDVKVIQPKSGKRIGIDEIREIEKFLRKKPLKLKKSLVVIHEAESLTIQAQNALLKTLEEPPENSKIVLETKNENNLLPTITSRCQIKNLGTKNLIEEASPEHNEQVKIFLELIKMDKGKRLDFIDNNKQKIADRVYAVYILDIWVSVLRDIMLLNTNQTEIILNRKNAPFIKEVNLDTKHIIELIGLANKFKNNLQNINVPTRLALELFLLDI